MSWITEFGLKRTRLTILAMVGLLLIGTLLYNGFSKREDPEITIRTSVVTVTFPGMTPKRMERLIADPVERKIREIPEVDELKTLITTGRMSIDVVLDDKVKDLDPIWQELRDKMEEIARELPEGSEGPFVNTNFGDVSIASIALTAEGFSFREMEQTAENLQRQLYTLDGVAKVDLYGVQDERIWLEIDAERLAAMGLQIETLIDDLQKQNVILPAGNLNADGTNLLLEASGDFESVRDISKLLTKVEGLDDFVQLKDLLTVRRGVVSPKEKPVFFNGRPALIVAVQMQSRYDIEAVGKKLARTVASHEEALPLGYELDFATFQPSKVSISVDNALINVVQTFIVVLLVMIIFLGWRSALIISSIVPFAVMFSLIGMNILGISLEQVSIAAIIISLGLLVDNGVVMVEDIMRRINNGEEQREAAMHAGQQFTVPLLVSSATTIFAFMPFFLLEGGEGEYAFSLGAVVAITLIGSWLSAIYFLPFLAQHFLRQSSSGQADTGGDTLATKMQQLYDRLLRKALGAASLVLAVCYAAVVGASVLLVWVPSEMFPLSDRNQILIYADMPKGTHISATEKSARAVSDWLLDERLNPEIESHVLYVGSGGPRFYLSLDPADTSPETAFLLVNTRDFDGAIDLSKRASSYLLENHPEARFKIKRLSMGASESGIVEVKITGPELDGLLSLGDQVENLFRDLPGLSQNENDWGDKILKVLIDIDQDKARRTGVTSESMAQLLSAYFDGYKISSYREDDQSIPIVLRASEGNRDSADDLNDITLGTNGELFALEQVATLRPQLEYSQIRRENQVRTLVVSTKSHTLTAAQVLEYAQPGLDALELSGGYSITIGGEVADNSDINGKLAAGLPVAFLLMLIAIVFQFNSFRKTLIVFMSIPLIVIGIPLGLLILHQPMSFFGTLGMIALAGIIINNAIVFIDQMGIECEQLPVREAVLAAAEKRLRPVLLTSATTVVGLVPLYLFGGSLWSPLAVVMMSGLTLASILTLFFVPAAYYTLFREKT